MVDESAYSFGRWWGGQLVSTPPECSTLAATDLSKTIKLMGRSKIFVDENFLLFFVRFLIPPKCQVLISTLTVLHTIVNPIPKFW